MSATSFRRKPKPIPAQHPEGSWLLRLFLICLLGVGGYGAYFGYCKYKVSEIASEFSKTARDLHQSLLRKSTSIRKAEVEQVVRAMAAKHDLEIRQLSVVLEPLTDSNRAKLPLLARETIGRQGAIFAARKATPGMENLVPDLPSYYLAGFSGTFGARYKVAKGAFSAARYTYFEENVVAK